MIVPAPEDSDNLVYYCLSCHSLYIIVDNTVADEEWDGSYCGKCHSTDIGVCDINDWLAEENRRKRKLEEIEWNK